MGNQPSKLFFTDDSLQVFYDDLLQKIIQDKNEESFSDFSYYYVNRLTPPELIQKLETYDSSKPFYDSFVNKNDNVIYEIKSINDIKCVKRGKVGQDDYHLRFTVYYTKKNKLKPTHVRSRFNHIQQPCLPRNFHCSS